jgi:gliding motility-associated lipoprotein GldD
MGKTSKFILLLLILPCLIIGCRNQSFPKPRGHFRIDFPEKQYILYDSTCPFTFYYPVYGRIAKEPGLDEPCWFNIEFPDYGGKLHLSYLPLENNLELLIDDAHKLAYKHSVKADAIDERIWENNKNRVYGLVYNIKGNAASSLQFYLTDSINHYLRGSLYFNAAPDKDSLAPVNEFFREDVLYLIETLDWKTRYR